MTRSKRIYVLDTNILLHEPFALTTFWLDGSLTISAEIGLEEAQRRGLVPADNMLDTQRQSLWDARVGDDPFWADFEREMPGFLKALLVLSPDSFTGFFDYCAIPWKSGTVPARVKELASRMSRTVRVNLKPETTIKMIMRPLELPVALQNMIEFPLRQFMQHVLLR